MDLADKVKKNPTRYKIDIRVKRWLKNVLSKIDMALSVELQ